GDQNYTPTSAASGSGFYNQVVNPDATTTMLVTDHPSGAVFGEPVTFTATVTNTSTGSAPFGTVTFVDTSNNAVLGQVPLSNPVGNTATAALTVSNLTAGTPHHIVATFNASASFSGSSAAVDQTITTGTVSVTLQTSQSPSTFGQGV